MAMASGGFCKMSWIGFKEGPLDMWRESDILIENGSAMPPMNKARGILPINSRKALRPIIPNIMHSGDASIATVTILS